MHLNALCFESVQFTNESLSALLEPIQQFRQKIRLLRMIHSRVTDFSSWK